MPNTRPADGAVLSEEQIRADERNRIAAETRAAEEKRVAEEAEKQRAIEAANRLRMEERTRVQEIMKLCRDNKLDSKLADEAITRGDTVDAFKEIVKTALATRTDERDIRGSNAGFEGRFDRASAQIVRDELDGLDAAMTEAMTIRVLSARRDVPGVISAEQKAWVERMGRTDMVAKARRIYDGHDKPQNERAVEFLGRSLVEIAAQCIGWRNTILPGNVDEIFARAYRTRFGGQFQAVGDFPSIFENVLNKSLLARYTLAMPTYREIAIERTFNDFRPHPQIRAGEFPTLLPLTETGEIKSGTTAESKETVSVTPYGRMFNISRQMMVNDEMGAIDQMLGSAGDTVLRFENTTFFTMFASNPTLLQDSTAVFAAGHSNLASPGGNPSVATIAAGRQAIREMKSLTDEPLNAVPRIILAGPSQETAVDQMLTSITPALSTSVNPFSGKLRAVNDALITGDEWYLFAEPGQIPCFVYGFLAGSAGPRTRTEEPFGYQGVRVELSHDFGCGAIDYRGAYKDEGSGPSGT